jgi:hypothetical protein
VTDAQSFLDRWSMVWNGPDSDPQLYMELAPARGVPLINPSTRQRAKACRSFIEAVLAVEPDIHVVLPQAVSVVVRGGRDRQSWTDPLKELRTGATAAAAMGDLEQIRAEVLVAKDPKQSLLVRTVHDRRALVDEENLEPVPHIRSGVTSWYRRRIRCRHGP